jgi:hypothetical protein
MLSGTRKLTVAAVGAIAVVLIVVPAIAAAQPLSFDFTAGRQGWKVSQNNGGNPLTDPAWTNLGGNPGGYVYVNDTGDDSGCTTPGTPCNLVNFVSPAIAGGLSANYGGTASIDLKSSIAPHYAADIALYSTASNTYVDGTMPETSGLTFHHLSTPLAEGATWQFCNAVTSTCGAVSQAQFKTSLAATDVILLGADVGSDNAGGETYSLDNVVLTDGPPPPPVVPVVKKKKCKKKKKHHASVAKKKKCKKKKKKKAKKTSSARRIAG